VTISTAEKNARFEDRGKMRKKKGQPWKCGIRGKAANAAEVKVMDY
jgi:hypothetical protein